MTESGPWSLHLFEIPPCIRHDPSSEIFLMALSHKTSGLELVGGDPATDTFGHEPALVPRCGSPAKLLLGLSKFASIPRGNDARRCHPYCCSSEDRPAAMASYRTSERVRRLGIARTRRRNGFCLME
jgi:hypothetical protein